MDNHGTTFEKIDDLGVPLQEPPYTLWLFNIAMENCLFIGDFPIKNFHFWWIFHGYVK